MHPKALFNELLVMNWK